MTEDQFLQLAREKYSSIRELNDSPSLLEYEQGFTDLWTEFGRSVIEANLGDSGNDRRKKKPSTARSAGLK